MLSDVWPGVARATKHIVPALNSSSSANLTSDTPKSSCAPVTIFAPVASARVREVQVLGHVAARVHHHREPSPQPST